ncbi:MAG: class I SAM-dependent methyltransferase [Bdellovibrionales bacterium]|nr:class I SAM-dependent methyltransferase [Bdellovibrionales bacterium]
MRTANPLKSLCFTILAQTIALAISLQARNIGLNPIIYISLHIFIAFFIARLLGASLPWLILNLILPLGILLFTGATIPNWIIGTFLCFVLLVYIPTFFTRVPFFATDKEVYEKVLKNLPDNNGLKFFDLGCGFGGLLFFLASQRPNQKFYGIELSPLCWLYTKIQSLICRNKNVEIYFGNFWDLSFSNFDIIYTFLAPPPMPKVWEKIRTDSGPKTLISFSFEVPNLRPSKTINLSSKKSLYFYQV